MERRHRVVATHHPRRRWLIVGAATAAFALFAFGLYRVVRATTVSDFERAQTEREQLLQERRTLTRELRESRADNQGLREQVAYLTRSQEIDGTACSSVKQSLVDLQKDTSELREQLAFYRGIVSPQESQAGVRVYEFKIRKTAAADRYGFSLVLIQPVRQDRRIEGAIDLGIEGLSGAQKRTVKFKDIALEPIPDMVFSFKYFQEFSGTLRLPEGFRPLRVRVSLAPKGDSAPSVDDEYDWDKVIREAGAT